MIEIETIQKASPHGHCIFCEDIRQEVNGKEIFVGVFPGSEMFVFGSLPTNIGKFAIKVFYAQLPSDPLVPMTIEVMMPGDDEASAKIELDLAKAAEAFPPPPDDGDGDDVFMGLQFTFVFNPLEIKKEGVIRVRAVREGKSFKLGSLSVKPHPVEPQQEEAAN